VPQKKKTRKPQAITQYALFPYPPFLSSSRGGKHEASTSSLLDGLQIDGSDAPKINEEMVEKASMAESMMFGMHPEGRLEGSWVHETIDAPDTYTRCRLLSPNINLSVCVAKERSSTPAIVCH
jgi:hypothetical protein